MSRNHRSRHREKLRNEEAAVQSRSAPRVYDFSGFDGANSSDRRGWIHHLPLDTSKELTGYALRLIRRNSRWLYANSGYARVLNILANLIGYFTVQPATKDKKWNRLAKERWINRTKSASVFDVAGRFNHPTWQLALSRSRLKDGDILTTLVNAASGSAQIGLYEAHQIDNGSDQTPPKNLRDGVFFNPNGRHTGYRIIDMADDSKNATIAASDSIYFGDFERPGQLRGYPALAHAINDLLDITEIDADTKLGIKRRQFVGLYKKKSAPTERLGLFTPTESTDTGVTITGSDGASKAVMINVEKARDGNGIANLEPNEDFGVVESDQPGPNETEFNKRLLHKIALGLGLPSQILFALAGLGGPEVRFQMAMLARWIEVEHLRLLEPNRAFYFFWLISEMNRSRDPLPFPDDDQFWKALYIPQSDLTIDQGREGRLRLEQLRMGTATFADVWDDAGGDWESQFELQAEIIATVRRIAEERSLTLADLMPGWTGGQQIPNTAPASQSPAPGN